MSRVGIFMLMCLRGRGGRSSPGSGRRVVTNPDESPGFRPVLLLLGVMAGPVLRRDLRLPPPLVALVLPSRATVRGDRCRGEPGGRPDTSNAHAETPSIRDRGPGSHPP